MRLLALAAVAVLLSGCGASSSPSRVLRIGIVASAVVGHSGVLNPFSGVGGDYGAINTIYPSLVLFDVPALNPVPYVATSWTVSRDGLTWTFRLRPNMRWSDGQPLTARDVAWTLTTLLKFKNGVAAGFASNLGHLVSASAPNATTVVLRYNAPVSNVLAEAGSVQIFPEHVWARAAAGNGSGLPSFVNAPAAGHPVVSGGPFTVTELKPNQFVLFARNPYYFGPRPALAGFGIQYFGTSDAMITALKAGQIDAAPGIPPTAVSSLRASGFVVPDALALTEDDLFINPTPGKLSHRELLDPRVREAIDMAVDRQQIVNVVYLGHAQPGSVIEPPAFGKWRPSIPSPAFDPAAANRLLDAAGYKRGPGGVRLADGHPMTYQVLGTPDSDREFAIIQSGLQRIGINVILRTLDPPAEFAAISANGYRNYDLALRAIPVGPLDPDFNLSVYACFTRGIYNWSGFCNPTYDRLYRQQESVTSGRVRIVTEMQRILYDQRPALVLAYPDELNAWSKHWTGFAESPAFATLSVPYMAPYNLTGVHRTG